MVWVVTLRVEAFAKAIVIKLNSYQTAFVWDQILPVVAFACASASDRMPASWARRVGHYYPTAPAHGLVGRRLTLTSSMQTAVTAKGL